MGVPVLDQQQETVASATPSARALVIAGPGSGKTEVAAARVLHLLTAGVPPAGILVLSFSRSAARTLTRRIERIQDIPKAVSEELRHVSIRTFDSWCFRVLRQLGFSPQALLESGYEANIDRLVDAISGERREDLTALLAGVRHVLVDELQDLGGARGALVLELLGLVSKREVSPAGFTLLGDEAQGIYEFAVRVGFEKYAHLTSAKLFGSLRRNFLGAMEEIQLDHNYRAAPKLASLAKSLRRILTRAISATDKLEAMQRLFGAIPERTLTADQSATTFVQEGNAAILTQTNGEAIRVAQLLWGKSAEAPAIDIALTTANQTTQAPAWVGATLGPMRSASVSRNQFAKAYCHLYGEGDNELAQAVGVPEQSSAWARLCYAAGQAADAPSIDLGQFRPRLQWPDAFPEDEGTDPSALQIMTVHQSKGQEFHDVTVLQPNKRGEGITKGAEDAEGEAQERANVIFVAITRAGATIRRMAAPEGLAPLWTHRFPSGRNRWRCWNNGWVNMEMGVQGDLAPNSFVDQDLHGSEAAVQEVQEHLATRARVLRGRKVMLKKRPSAAKPEHFVYGVHLQEGGAPGRLLGCASEQLTRDLFHQVWDRGYGLPSSIFNLRISDVVTLSVTGDPVQIAPRYATSGIWLGVQLYGTGDFQPPARGRRR